MSLNVALVVNDDTILRQTADPAIRDGDGSIYVSLIVEDDSAPNDYVTISGTPVALSRLAEALTNAATRAAAWAVSTQAKGGA